MLKNIMYMQGIEKINLFIKEGTPDVPNDKKYYVIKDGNIIGSFRDLENALKLYKKYIPEKNEKQRKSASVEDLKKYDFNTKSALEPMQVVKKKKSGRYHKIK